MPPLLRSLLLARNRMHGNHVSQISLLIAQGKCQTISAPPSIKLPYCFMALFLTYLPIFVAVATRLSNSVACIIQTQVPFVSLASMENLAFRVHALARPLSRPCFPTTFCSPYFNFLAYLSPYYLLPYPYSLLPYLLACLSASVSLIVWSIYCYRYRASLTAVAG